jgi:alpha-beta hydrolase superfamily lysophospholipase
VPGFGLVHLGFEAMWRRIRNSVTRAIERIGTDVPITMLGHSLGGAMAILGAVDIKKNFNRPNIDVCTFGGPRVGKVRFRQNFNKLIDPCFRVTNQGDVVPHVPSVITAWNHVGLEIEVNGRRPKPHSLESYKAGLEALQRQPESAPSGRARPEGVGEERVIAAATR